MNYDELAFQISACNRRRIYQLEEIDRQVATALASVDKRIEGLSSSSGNISNQVQQNTQTIGNQGEATVTKDTDALRRYARDYLNEYTVPQL